MALHIFDQHNQYYQAATRLAIDGTKDRIYDWLKDNGFENHRISVDPYNPFRQGLYVNAFMNDQQVIRLWRANLVRNKSKGMEHTRARNRHWVVAYYDIPLVELHRFDDLYVVNQCSRGFSLEWATVSTEPRSSSPSTINPYSPHRESGNQPKDSIRHAQPSNGGIRNVGW